MRLIFKIYFLAKSVLPKIDDLDPFLKIYNKIVL